MSARTPAKYQTFDRETAQRQGAAKATAMRKMPPRWTMAINRIMWRSRLIGNTSINTPQVDLPKKSNSHSKNIATGITYRSCRRRSKQMTNPTAIKMVNEGNRPKSNK